MDIIEEVRGHNRSAVNLISGQNILNTRSHTVCLGICITHTLFISYTLYTHYTIKLGRIYSIHCYTVQCVTVFVYLGICLVLYTQAWPLAKACDILYVSEEANESL